MQNESCRNDQVPAAFTFLWRISVFLIYPSRAESLENSCPLAFSN